MEKLDLVYILGKGSRWNDNEIRYSLRSIEKNFPNAGRVFIIGEKPDWIKNIVHIPVNDNFENKLLNARAKYITAATNQQISSNFILMNDDFFFIKPTMKIKNYSRGTLGDMLELHPTKNGYYYRSLWDTRKRLDAMGIPDAIDFEIHAPIIFNKEKLLSVIGMIGSDKAYSIRSCYGNLMNLKPETTMDFKAANTEEYVMQMDRAGAHFLSINDALVANEHFRNWMREMFPVMSKYEQNELGLEIMPGRPIAKRQYHAKKEFRWDGKIIHRGDIMPDHIINPIKDNPALGELWEWN